MQLGLLAITFIYLYLRSFDFSNWKIKVNFKSILMGIAIFIGVALLFDIYYTVLYRLFPIDNAMLYEAQQTSENLSIFQNIDLSLILYSMLNGFYEEIFFLGFCLSVKP